MPSFDSICARDVPDPRTIKPHVLPLYLTSSYDFESIDHQIAVFKKEEQGHVYSRYGNPTVEAVAAKIAALEGYGLDFTPHAILTSSGMAAIHTLLMGVLETGDKILTQGNLYGGTTELLLRIAKRAGIGTVLTDLTRIDSIETALESDSSIKLVFFETPTNPTLDCIDIEAVASLCQKRNVLTAIDNTFATPYLQQPLRWGIDFIVHSTTKYLNGHGNSIAGAVVGRDAGLMRKKLWDTMKLIGTNPGPMDAWLTHQGMKTLTLRMDRHCENAMSVASYLSDHPSVSTVNYTGLPTHPYHELAKRQMRDFGGMLSFEVKGGMEGALKFLRRIEFCSLAPTLGDVDTLILHPVTSSHLNIAPEIREANGITDGLIRISVGIEAVDDIIADLSHALKI